MDEKQEQEVIGEVRERYPDIDFPNVMFSPLWYGRREHTMVDEKQAIIVNHKGEEYVSAVCSDQYKILPHEVAIKEFEDACKTQTEFGEPQFNINLLCFGSKLMMDAKFPEANMTITDNDAAHPKASMKNSYDLGWEYGLLFGAERQVCTNGMVAFAIESSIKKKHRLNLDVKESITYLGEGMKQFSIQHNLWSSWAHRQIEAKEILEVVEELPFGKNHTEEILALPETATGEKINDWVENGMTTIWNLYNVYTQFLSHGIDSELVRLDKGEKVARIFHRRYGNV